MNTNVKDSMEILNFLNMQMNEIVEKRRAGIECYNNLYHINGRIEQIARTIDFITSEYKLKQSPH